MHRTFFSVGGTMGIPRAVHRAIAGFNAECLFTLPPDEIMLLIHHVEEVLNPDALPYQRFAHWIMRARHSRDMGDEKRSLRYAGRATDILYDLEERSLHEFHKAFGAASLFKLESALFSKDESPLEEALVRLADFVDVFMEISTLDDVRSAKKVKSPLPADPIKLLRDLRVRAMNGDHEYARKWLGILDHTLTGLIDAALAKNWVPPAPYGAILTRRVSA